MVEAEYTFEEAVNICYIMEPKFEINHKKRRRVHFSDEEGTKIKISKGGDFAINFNVLGSFPQNVF